MQKNESSIEKDKNHNRSRIRVLLDFYMDTIEIVPHHDKSSTFYHTSAMTRLGIWNRIT